jgi:protein-disulfide isomerase
MEHGDPKMNRWAEERLARLEPAAEWRPDADRGLARLRQKSRSVRRRRWGVTLAGALALASSLFVIPGCQAATCRQPSENLAERLWKTMFRDDQVATPRLITPPAAPALKTQQDPPAPPVPVSPAPRWNFKHSGSAAAKVTCEIYTDYECPACASFYAEIVPQFVTDYVATGKVKLVHRDYPLTMHRHSRLAARFANAAGEAGHYETAVSRIFRTQSAWGLTGDIDTQLAEVLAPEIMAKVRRLVQNDARLDETVESDIEQGRADQIRSTPSIVIAANGQRTVYTHMDYTMLKNALDAVLK